MLLNSASRSSATVSPLSSCNLAPFPSAGHLIRTPEGVVYELLRFLGRGSFGQTFEVIDVATGKRLALKVLETATQKQRNDNVTEINNNMFLRNSGSHNYPLMEFHDFFTANDKLCVLFEKLDTTLFEVFLKTPGPMGINALKTIAYQMFAGIARLHHLGIAHCDLKLDNIMYVNRSGLNPFDVKLIDFGLLHPISILKQIQGSVLMARGYRAPEICLGLPLSGKVDIWSAGVILYELFTGRPMLQSVTDNDTTLQIHQIFGLPIASAMFGCHYHKYFGYDSANGLHQPICSVSYNQSQFATPYIFQNLPQFGLSKQLFGRPQSDDFVFHDLLRRILSVDSNYRLSAEQVLQHPFFAIISC